MRPGAPTHLPRATIPRWRTRRWVPAGMARVIIGNATSLIASTGLTSGLGAIFWLVAAHGYSPAAVGLAGAAVSAMTLLGTLATLGFGTALIGELPRRRADVRPLVTSSMVAAGLVGAVIGAGFALVAPYASASFGPLSSNAGIVGVFAGGVAITAMALVFDGATIGLLRSRLQLRRNAVFAVGKLLILVAAVLIIATRGGIVIFIVWALGTLLSLALLLVPMLRHPRRHSPSTYRPRVAFVRSLWRSAFGHHAYNLAFTVPSFALPLIVVGILSVTANAGFYVAFMIAGFTYVIPNALTKVLFAVGSLEPEALAARIRLTLGLSLAACLIAIVVLLVGAPLILGLFGHRYATATGTLRTLSLAALPMIVKTHFLAVTRIQQRVLRSMPIVWGGALLEIGLGVVGAATLGVLGVALGWLAAVGLEAIVMGKTVHRAAMPMSGKPLAARP